MIKMSIFAVLIVLIVLIIPSISSENKAASAATFITQEELRGHTYFLASDEIGGRMAGTPGYEIATKYAVSQFMAAGLEPLFKDSSGGATYLQKVPLIKRKIYAPEPITIVTPEGNFSFAVSEENIRYVNHTKQNVFTQSLPLIFIGYGIEEPEHNWHDLKGLDLKGKIAVMLSGAPTKKGKPVLPEELHNMHSSIMGMKGRIMQLLLSENAPEALILISNEMVEQAWNALDTVIGQKIYALAINVPDLLIMLPPELIIVKPDIGKTLFKGQIYNPFDSSDINLRSYKRYELKGADIKFQLVYEDEKIISWNIVGIVKGTDQAFNNEYIMVGAHLDSAMTSGTEVANGADDNASGSAGLLEIIEAVARTPFKRSVIFALWTAEECGALGSQYFVENSPIPLNTIKMNVTLDMIGSSTKENEESRTHLVEGFDDSITTSLKEFIEKINQETVQWPLSYFIREMIAGSSDHASFYKKGIPVIRFYSGHHDDVHESTDDAEKLDYEKMEKISQLTYYIIQNLAEK